MATKEEFNLESFLTDSLNLRMNTTYPTKPMFSVTEHDPYCDLIKEDPLVVLGERKFGPPRDVPEDVIGTPIQEFFRGAHVLITGGTGFVGKVLTEKLVRSVPHLGHVYLLIRAKRGVSSQQRFDKLLEDQLYSRMKAEVPQYQSKISVVEGDLSEPDLGMSAADRQTLIDNVSLVFHSAADVRFMEPLRATIISNVVGSKRVLDFSRELPHLKSYVHVSTAYSQCVKKVIDETVPKMNISQKEIIKYIENRTEEELQKETLRILQGWPNTYTFSKAVCEDMIQEEARGLPVCIFRPSVVCPTYKEPVRGWTDNLHGPTGMFVGAGHGIVHCLRIGLETTSDTVPVDYVVNCMIAVAWRTGTYRMSNEIPVYNFTAFSAKPVTWKMIANWAQEHKSAWPFRRAIWYPSCFLTESYYVNQFCHYTLHRIPGMILDKVTELSGNKPMLSKIYLRLESLKELLHYFVSNIWEFKNDNVKNLWKVLDQQDKAMFFFDVSDVDHKEHFLVSKLGVKYYYLKEKLEDLPVDQRKNNWLYWAHTTLKTLFGLAALKLMVLTAHALPI